MNRTALTDEDLMPPPSGLYVQGSWEFAEALERGTIAVSGPRSPRRKESPPSLVLRSCSDPAQASFAPAISLVARSEFPPSAMKRSASDCRDPHACESDTTKENAMSEEMEAMQSFESSSMPSLVSTTRRAAMLEATRLCDIVGHKNAKLRIGEVLMSISPRFSRYMTGIRALPASILLSGPPGCGKTKLARAIAGESRAAFLSVRPSDILSKYVGESEGRMRAVFTEAWDQACLVASKVAVVFFDEIDAIGHTRGGGEFGVGEGCSRRVLAELLLQLTELEDQVKTQRSRRGHRPLQSWQASADSPSRDHTETCCASSQPRIVVVAATNRTGDCDQALLRRFGIQLHVGLPTVEDREKLLVRLLDGVSHSLDSHQIGQLASMTQGKSGSDLESLTRAAAMAPVDECILSASDFRNSPRYGPSSASAGSSGTCESAANLDESVHDYLETLLKNLRPVCMEDFVKACGDPGCSEAGYQGA